MKTKEELVKEKGDFILDIIDTVMNAENKITGVFNFGKFDDNYELRIDLDSRVYRTPIYFAIDLNQLFESDGLLLEHILTSFIEKYRDSETIGIEPFEQYHEFIHGFQNKVKVYNLTGSNIKLSWQEIKDIDGFKKAVDSYNATLIEYVEDTVEKKTSSK